MDGCIQPVTSNTYKYVALTEEGCSPRKRSLKLQSVITAIYNIYNYSDLEKRKTFYNFQGSSTKPSSSILYNQKKLIFGVVFNGVESHAEFNPGG